MTLRIKQNGAVVIRKFDDGVNWFRIWSDGWIEQGSFLTSVVANAGIPFTINYITPFSKPDHQMINMITFEPDAADSGSNLVVAERTTTNFKGMNVNYSRNPLSISWYACGY